MQVINLHLPGLVKNNLHLVVGENTNNGEVKAEIKKRNYHSSRFETWALEEKKYKSLRDEFEWRNKQAEYITISSDNVIYIYNLKQYFDNHFNLRWVKELWQKNDSIKSFRDTIYKWVLYLPIEDAYIYKGLSY